MILPHYNNFIILILIKSRISNTKIINFVIAYHHVQILEIHISLSVSMNPSNVHGLYVLDSSVVTSHVCFFNLFHSSALTTSSSIFRNFLRVFISLISQQSLMIIYEFEAPCDFSLNPWSSSYKFDYFHLKLLDFLYNVYHKYMLNLNHIAKPLKQFS